MSDCYRYTNHFKDYSLYIDIYCRTLPFYWTFGNHVNVLYAFTDADGYIINKKDKSDTIGTIGASLYFFQSYLMCIRYCQTMPTRERTLSPP